MGMAQNNEQRQALDGAASASENETTKEQFNDVYAAGTSDGLVQLEEGVIRVPESDNEE